MVQVYNHVVVKGGKNCSTLISRTFNHLIGTHNFSCKKEYTLFIAL